LGQLRTLARQQSFDHFIGADEQCWRYIELEPERLRYLEIDDEIKPCGLLDRQIGRLDAPQKSYQLPRQDVAKHRGDCRAIGKRGEFPSGRPRDCLAKTIWI
jgi:hypothetical protein